MSLEPGRSTRIRLPQVFTWHVHGTYLSNVAETILVLTQPPGTVIPEVNGVTRERDVMAMMKTKQRAIFLDKDGTLVENVPYSADVLRMRLTDRAGAALRLLSEAGFALFVVSNQSGIARGLFPDSAVPPMREHLEALLEQEHVFLAGFYYCPHHPDGLVAQYALPCTCRKPAPGMLHLAAREHNIELRSSWLIGDILDDIEAGNRALCRTILLDNGGETEWRMDRARRPDHVARDLYEAAWQVLAHETSQSIAGGVR